MRVSFQFFRRLLPAAKQVLVRGALVRAREAVLRDEQTKVCGRGLSVRLSAPYAIP